MFSAIFQSKGTYWCRLVLYVDYNGSAVLDFDYNGSAVLDVDYNGSAVLDVDYNGSAVLDVDFNGSAVLAHRRCLNMWTCKIHTTLIRCTLSEYA